MQFGRGVDFANESTTETHRRMRVLSPSAWWKGKKVSVKEVKGNERSVDISELLDENRGGRTRKKCELNSPAKHGVADSDDGMTTVLISSAR